jgi:bifunctional enzyme CysN/CysC
MTTPALGSASPLRIVIVGHVDHGKSTLVGRLCHDTGSLPEGKLEQLQATCKKRGVPFEWAFVMDALQAERDQNITIDTSQIWFSTTQRPYVIIDAPGHEEFIKNMVTGAASAHAAVLLIAADEGVRAQSKRHGALLQLLGLTQLIVVVNKMDAVGWSQQTYDTITTEYSAFLTDLGVSPRAFIPISAREGAGLVHSGAAQMPWYDGPTLVQALDLLERPFADSDSPLRLPIQDVYRFDERRILSGRVEAGRVKAGDTLTFWPGGRSARVKALEVWPAQEGSAPQASAGASIGVTLEDQIFAERGHIATLAGEPAPIVARSFIANIFWLGKEPVRVGSRYRLKLATQEVDAEISEVISAIDAATLDTSAQEDGVGRVVRRHEAGRIRIQTRQPVALDRHETSPITGRFVLVSNLDVAGGGIVLDATPWEERSASGAGGPVTPVTALERAQRQRHRGAIVLFSLHKGIPSQELLFGLERALFDRGISACVLTPRFADLEDVEIDREAHALVARNLAGAGLVCIVGSPITGSGAELAAFRRMTDTRALSTIAVHEGKATPLIASAVKLPGEQDDALLSQDHDLVIPDGLDDAARVNATIELLIPWLQHF